MLATPKNHRTTVAQKVKLSEHADIRLQDCTRSVSASADSGAYHLTNARKHQVRCTLLLGMKLQNSPLAVSYMCRVLARNMCELHANSKEVNCTELSS